MWGLVIGQIVGGCILGILRIEIKHVNHKTCVHQISEISLMKWVQAWLEWECGCVQLECVVVDWWCRGSNGKVKIEGYMSVSDEEAHHRHSCILIHSNHPPPRYVWWCLRCCLPEAPRWCPPPWIQKESMHYHLPSGLNKIWQYLYPLAITLTCWLDMGATLDVLCNVNTLITSGLLCLGELPNDP